MKWEIKYREDLKSFWIEAFDNRNKRYVFSTHALERAWTRSTNLHTMQDFQKPIGRIIRCTAHYGVTDWVNRHIKNEERFVIHDIDNSMAYVIGNNTWKDTFVIISTFNEFWTEFKTIRSQKEIWLSIINDQWWDRV